jgi:hypothetical protein
MPSADQILNGLREIANSWRTISILWHIYFGALALALAFGFRPSKRMAGLLLGLPFLSVGAFGWLSSNPFNGVVFPVVGIVFLAVAAKLPRDSVRIAPIWTLIPGVLLFAFGWIYPEFLDTSSHLPYLYMAPTGIIPCATLIIVIGSALVVDGLGSRALGTILGIVGLLYGMMGVVYLHVALDWALILGGAMILVHTFSKKPVPLRSSGIQP